VFYGGHEAARLLLEHGADLNIPGYGGETPLHCASSSGKSKIVRLLLDHGAHVDAVDESGKTAFQLALVRGHDEIVTLLKAYDTDASS